MIGEGKRKISIIGAGFVGATTAYALMNGNLYIRHKYGEGNR